MSRYNVTSSKGGLAGVSAALHRLIIRPARLIIRPAMICALVALTAAVAIVSGRDTVRAHNFAPCYQTTLSDASPGAASDIKAVFGIGIGADCQKGTADDDPKQYNFGAVISFTPREWGVKSGAEMPDGTPVGTLFSRAVLGVLNNPCTTTVNVNFQLVDGTTDTSRTVDPRPAGQSDRLKPLSEDRNGNGLPDGVDSWPSFLSTLFEGVDMSKLRARGIGINTREVPGTTVVLNFMLFEPGTRIRVPGGPFFDVDPGLGYPSVTVLQGVTPSAADPVNDFCSPLFVETTTLAAVRTNPGEGAYNFVIFTASQLDADEDGIENALDPCPLTADPTWDPRGARIQNPGDQDGDGLPDSCDPDPVNPSKFEAAIGLVGTDEDNDDWMNRNDNCTLVANPDQKDTDLDGLGDACDPNANSPDGHFHLQCLVAVVPVGAGGTPAFNAQDVRPCNPNAPLTSDTGTGGGADGGAAPAPVAPSDGTQVAVAGAQRGAAEAPAVGPASGVGSLAPAVGGLPVWAPVLTGLGGAGLLGLAVRVLGRLLRRR